jgi:hypothetical protein
MLRVLMLLVVLAPAGLPQSSTGPATLSLEQKEEFLKNAKEMQSRDAKKGITNTKRATLSDGSLTHDASIQTIDDRQASFQTAMGTELNFRDTYKFNIAAYRLGRLLGLGDMIPPSVARSREGKSAAWTWWIDDVLMDEGQRLKQKLAAPDKDQWARQYQIMRVFDQLIYNTDRNLGNILYDKNWRLWMIDHTRAFRQYTTLHDPKLLERCDRQLLANLKRLDEKTVTEAIGPWTEPPEIRGLLARRDKIVAFFVNRGEAALYDFLPSR